MSGDQDTPVPVACTLGAGDIPGRVAEWQAFYRERVRTTERSATSARLLLDPSDGAVVVAASLGQRETECCAFFTFTIALEAEARWLTLTVPPEAGATLTGFLDMLADG